MKFGTLGLAAVLGMAAVNGCEKSTTANEAPPIKADPPKDAAVKTGNHKGEPSDLSQKICADIAAAGVGLRLYAKIDNLESGGSYVLLARSVSIDRPQGQTTLVSCGYQTDIPAEDSRAKKRASELVKRSKEFESGAQLDLLQICTLDVAGQIFHCLVDNRDALDNPVVPPDGIVDYEKKGLPLHEKGRFVGGFDPLVPGSEEAGRKRKNNVQEKEFRPLLEEVKEHTDKRDFKSIPTSMSLFDYGKQLMRKSGAQKAYR